MLDGGLEFFGTFGEGYHEVAQGLDTFEGFVALGAEIGVGVGGVEVEHVVGESATGAIAK